VVLVMFVSLRHFLRCAKAPNGNQLRPTALLPIR
jgi:hypothetical protein